MENYVSHEGGRFETTKEFYEAVARQLFQIFGEKDSKPLEYYLINFTPLGRQASSDSIRSMNPMKILKAHWHLYQHLEITGPRPKRQYLAIRLIRQLQSLIIQEDTSNYPFTYALSPKNKVVHFHFKPDQMGEKGTEVDVFNPEPLIRILQKLYKEIPDHDGRQVTGTSRLYNYPKYAGLYPVQETLEEVGFQPSNFLHNTVYGQFLKKGGTPNNERIIEFFSKIMKLDKESAHEDIYRALPLKPLRHRTPLKEYFKMYKIS